MSEGLGRAQALMTAGGVDEGREPAEAWAGGFGLY